MTPELYRNRELPLEQRIDDLLSRMTLPEKVNQLLHDNSPIERLGLPAYNWWSEACHGVGRNGRATVFPQVIGMAASWNRRLIESIGGAIAVEARLKHGQAARAGRHEQYQGLTFWTPNINIFRDPRWGRGQETYGEDPVLTAELGAATVRGLQGVDTQHLKLAACAKHFAVHSGPEDERHTFDAKPSPRDLTDTYLPAFKRLVDEGVEAVMGAYNRVHGEPACGSKHLLVDLLRTEWKFQGHVVSDCGAIDDFHLHHKVTADSVESAALALRMGCDLNCGCTYNDLLLATQRGLISEVDVNRSLRRLLSAKFRLGLFDGTEPEGPAAGIPVEIVDGQRHRQLARQVAAEGIVLLKNKDNLLPLPANPASMLVVGPSMANIPALLGNYFGTSSRLVTLLEGIVARVDPSTRLKYRVGCPLTQDIPPGTNYTFPAAASSEIVIVALGLDPTLEGEEGDTVASSAGGDRARIELPQNQLNFLRELRKHSKKLILLLTGGSAVAIPEAHELCDAVLQVWYPGCEGGNAVADVLFGDVAPSGRLPVTVPYRTEDLPSFSSYDMQGRTYRYSDTEPLYPFGFGLSYSKCEYSVTASAPSLTPGTSLRLTCTLRNTGRVGILETAQCYLAAPAGTIGAPRQRLVAFEKVLVPASGSNTVVFELPADLFAQTDASGLRQWVPGSYTLTVGPSSPCARALVLGAAAPASTQITFELRPDAAAPSQIYTLGAAKA